MISQIDARLKEYILDTMSEEKNVSTMFRHECNLINPNSDFTLTVPVSSFSLIQNFVENYQDIVQVEVWVTPQQYRDIQTHMQDLNCSLLFYSIDRKTGVDLFDVPPLVFDYTVFMEKREDIDKQYNSNIFNDNKEEGQDEVAKKSQTRFIHKLTLVSKEMRDLRYKGVNTIARNATIESIIKWVCYSFEIEHVKAIPADNTQVYKHITIPPLKYISDVFPFLQYEYGIYAKGLAYYFTNKTLYMYPCFDFSKDTTPIKEVLHICNANNTMFKGGSKYHTIKEEDIFVTSTAGIKVSPIDVAATENSGDNIVTTNADALRDRFAPVGGDGKVDIGEGHQTTIQRSNSTNNSSSSSQNIRYGGCRNNIYVTTSELASKDGMFMSALWTNCIPGILQPGQHVVYHYSNQEGDMVTAKGRLMSVVYLSRTSPMSSIDTAMTFIAGLGIFLEPERDDD